MIEPLGGRILVERVPEPDRSIVLIDAEPSRRFKVLGIGPDVYDLEVGDVVLLPGIAANEPDHEAGKQILVHMDDVGVIVGR